MDQDTETVTKGPQECIEEAGLGTKIEAICRIHGEASLPVTLHCVEVLYDVTVPADQPKVANVKRFRAFSHGVEIKELVAIKTNGKWLPQP
jgi:hypothetical protein